MCLSKKENSKGITSANARPTSRSRKPPVPGDGSDEHMFRQHRVERLEGRQVEGLIGVTCEHRTQPTRRRTRISTLPHT